MTKETVDKTSHFNEKDVRTFYQHLGHSPDEFTEVRIIDPTRKTKALQKFVKSEDAFVKSIKRWSGKQQCYAGLNPRREKRGKAEHVSRVTAILLDIDAKHPKDEAATDKELAAAKKRLNKLTSWIKKQGYEPPFISMSGNGYHIIQKVDIKVDNRTQEQLRAYHHEVAGDLDSTFDLPRIVKIPGTMSVKGESSEERPHRLSFVVDKGSTIIDKKLNDHISSMDVELPDEPTDSKPSVEPTDDLWNRLKKLREDNPKLDLLLSTECPSAYKSASEADMATLSILKLSGSSEVDAISILRKFRGRDKLDRKDYIKNLVEKIYRRRGEVEKFSLPDSQEEMEAKGALSRFSQEEKLSTSPLLLYISPEQLESVLSTTIVEDTVSKMVTFLVGLLNYTESDQMNVGFSGPSSTGKTYVVLEVTDFFPKKDVMTLGYVSPKAFYHDHGKLLREDGSPLMARDEFVDLRMEKWELENPRETPVLEWRKKEAREKKKMKSEWNMIPKEFVVDLHQIIIVFLDQPHDKLLREIRPLLSHDRKKIVIKITDRQISGQHATKTITIVGYPTVYFLSTRFNVDEQERTRLLMLSAGMSQTKIEKSIEMLSRKLSNRDTFSQNVDHDEERKFLKERVQVIKAAEIREVIILEEDRKSIFKKFLDEHPTLVPRHQRDFPRLIALIKAFALLNLQDREKDKNGRLFANGTDIENGMSLYSKLAPSNELGMPPDLYDFWKNKIEPVLLLKGLHRKEISRLYYDHFEVRIGEYRRNKIIDLWLDIGLVTVDSDPEDARRKLIFSTEYDPQTYLFEKWILSLPDTNFIISEKDYNEFGAKAVELKLIERVGKKGEFRKVEKEEGEKEEDGL